MLSIAQYIPFLDNSNKLLQVRFCFSQVTAGQNITVTYIVVGMFGFPLGWFIDRVGYRRYFGVVGMVVFVVGHTVILLFPQCGG
jgi:MFS family permease